MALPLSNKAVIISDADRQRLEQLLPVSSDTDLTCPICTGDGIFFVARDFSVSGNDFFVGEHVFEPSNIDINYIQCTQCEFLWSPSFKNFRPPDYERLIYNAHYVLADPPYLSERPMKNAKMVLGLLDELSAPLNILDYGGGSGVFRQVLVENHQPYVQTYDTYHQNNTLPTRKFDLITLFEVIEHIYEQHALIQTLTDLLSDSGVILFSTLLHPTPLPPRWWYIQPRNGHISLHSEKSIAELFSKFGLDVRFLCADLHLAYRKKTAGPFVRAVEHAANHGTLCRHRSPAPMYDFA